MKIDELVLSLVLDVAGLKKGQAATEAALVAIRSESEKTDKSMQAGAKKNAEAQKKQGDAIAKNSKETEKADKKTQDGAKNNTHSYGKWLASILSIGAAMVALNKFKNFAVDLTNSDAAAGRMAENIGMATRDLTAFGNTADKLGGSAEAMTSDLFNMSQAIVGLRAGGELPEWLTDPKGFFKLGGDMLPKLLDDSVSMLDKAKMIQERMAAVPAPVAQYAGRKLGMSVGTVTAFHDTSWNRQLAIQYKLNAANEADAKLAQKRQIAWKMVQDAVESLGRGITTKISPAFLKVSDMLVKFLSNGENLKTFQHIVDSIVNAVTALAGVIAMAVSGIKQMLDLATGNKAADKGFLGNMLAILNDIAKVIDYILSGYRMIGELVTAEQAAPAAPTMLNGYNPGAKNRTGMEATKDVVLGVNNDLAQSMVALGKLIWNSDIAGNSTQAVWNRGHPVPTAGQRVGSQNMGVTQINSNNTTQDIKITAPSKEHAGIIRDLKSKPMGGQAPALAGGMQ